MGLREQLRVYEKALVLASLEIHHYNITQAARDMGLSRWGLYAICKRHGIQLLHRGENW